MVPFTYSMIYELPCAQPGPERAVSGAPESYTNRRQITTVAYRRGGASKHRHQSRLSPTGYFAYPIVIQLYMLTIPLSSIFCLQTVGI